MEKPEYFKEKESKNSLLGYFKKQETKT